MSSAQKRSALERAREHWSGSRPEARAELRALIERARKIPMTAERRLDYGEATHLVALARQGRKLDERQRGALDRLGAELESAGVVPGTDQVRISTSLLDEIVEGLRE